MNNFNQLTEKEMLDINGGGLNLSTIIKYGEPAYDFLRGVAKGFTETAKKIDD
ncbi:hypothetical protein CLOBY_03520 [Clostridium saccharobutylicum]|uniref:lactococcin G-beta/enterocin 1071B family bacteriocin n=1 Tax=Clostridium saccharobutylicum TaxID=169679 RepID=UPI000983CEF9|nr:lactococcin G-beta/enterocin 1071B family bacteriocin [Clostridium saccharobutylicum]AQS08280.1 hypothetical protein CLOBY_03520 [Clostridium saccharobutylicum]MBC2435833.1 lactococcin G-beta/enterocin 1071B family bacteriocin [Clostridium saccharobutylicum]NSB88356.1 hypothetical protein [Clostridium saccharobutylicum]NYC29393.1 hypothetical protein [Clostridium saccharobutylicum]OOM10922.1 hypothetical protein CLSAB_43050 [Clostridium saccharobutylicum]